MKLLTYSVRPSADSARPCGARPTSKRKHLPVAVGVDDRDLAAGLQRDEQVDAERVEDRGAGQAGVVVVDARRAGPRRCVARSMRELIARTVFWKFRPRAVAQRAALDVVLLGRHPGLLAVRRDRGRAEVVRACRGPGSRSRACRCGAGRWCGCSVIAAGVDDHAPRRRAAAVGCTVGGALARQRRRDEARDVDQSRRRRDRHVARVRRRRRRCPSARVAGVSNFSSWPVASSAT